MLLIKDSRWKIWLFCFTLSFLVIMIVSKSSFLYPLNDWGDANAFFTMGKSLFEGKIIFKDIFEQKGPFLYLIYGIGYLISNRSFLGVFFLEVISSTIFLYYAHKIITLYLEEKYSYIILPLCVFLIYTSVAFRHGSSCEEFCFPLLSYIVYQLLLFARNKDISYLKVFIVGILSGIILFTKYTLLGISFGFMLYIVLDFLIKKKIKKALISPFVFLGGMLLPVIPWLIYFLVNGALYDFFNTYIFINLFSYASSESISIVSRIFNCLILFFQNIIDSYIYGVLMLIGIVLFLKSKVNIREKVSIVCLLLFSILFIYIGGIYYLYYILPLSIFTIIAFIGLFLNLDYNFNFSNKLKVVYLLFILIISYFVSPNTYLLGTPKKNLVQYQFADIILEKANPTVLNYGWLDMGFYTVTGIVPNTKYFHTLNFDYEKYPDNMDSLNRYIKEKAIDFVVVVAPIIYDYPECEYLDENYEKVKEMVQKIEGASVLYTLYQLKT